MCGYLNVMIHSPAARPLRCALTSSTLLAHGTVPIPESGWGGTLTGLFGANAWGSSTLKP
jgi:hypothetical protein